MAESPEKYLSELRMIAVGHKSLPKTLVQKMHTAAIFLGCRRGKGPEEQDTYELRRVGEVLVADDMESCRTFGDCIFIAPQEELLEKFYSEMSVQPLSACIKYTVDPRAEIQVSQSQSADNLRKSIIEKIPIFLHEFDDQRFRHEMRLLRWRDRTQFFVRACKHLRVTKRLVFQHATVPPGRERYDTELSAETEFKDGVNVLWIKDHNPDSYDVASALCRLLFATYKKNDVLSLMTILDTPIDVLERRGYDVQRILKEYDDNLCKAGNGKTIPNGLQAPNAAPPPKDGPSPSRMMVPRKLAKWLQRLRKDPKLGEVKLSDIGDSIDKVKKIMNEPGGKDNTHISNREHVGGGKKRKNVGYCDEKKVAENDLEECADKQIGQIKVWKLKGTVSDVPSKECKDFVMIISELAKVLGINQTRCHVFYHTSDDDLMGFNRNDEIFFGLKHYIQKHKEVTPGKAYIYWYYIMAHEMAHVHTPYHDEHHELLSAALTEEYLTKLHDLRAVRDMFNCVPRP
ncbi:hypothetical protein M405DRAFT_938557 [Rhizopogon salebrosus TDB-379]|nr:hypothetical protein M405DRAFT_938557 [Rhizopogon salebrosus TDB-379]